MKLGANYFLFLSWRSPLAVSVTFFIACLYIASALFQSCDDTDPFFEIREDTCSTLVCIPELVLFDSHPSKAAYEGFDKIDCLDIFVFNDDEKRDLDSYCRISRPAVSYITVSSSMGEKELVIIANCSSHTFVYDEMTDYDALEELRWDLKDEDPSHPVMSGTAHFCAGDEAPVTVQMTPLLANVCLDFIKCDFTGRGYKSKGLDNASVYLTNVSASCDVLRQTGFRITDLANQGRLDTEYLSTVKCPEMLCYDGVILDYWKPIQLYCYPNNSEEGLMGSPRTKLVIQGDIDGETYYYPIDINQEGFGYSGGPYGLNRNIKYSYGIVITRKGSKDPDISVGPEKVTTQGWIQINPGNFLTGRTGESIHIWVDVYPEDTEVTICEEDLEYDAQNGIYDYKIDTDGKGVVLNLKDGGTGMFTVDAGNPVNDGFLVLVVVNP